MPARDRAAWHAHQTPRILLYVLLIVTATATACTRTVLVRQPFDENLDPDKGLAFEITTSGGQSYMTDAITRTDSSIVVHSILVLGKSTRIDDIELMISDITMIRRVEVSPWRLGVIIGITVVGLAALVTAIAKSLAAPP